MTLPSKETLASLFKYNPQTGLLTWKWRPAARPEWNSRYAGKSAGSDCGHGYIKVSIAKRLYYAHHIVWALCGDGALPDEIDHINGVRNDNRRSNLRASLRQQNACNRGVQKNTTSGLKGVYPLPSGRYCSRIRKSGVDCYLGSFDTADEAKAAYNAAARKLHGEFSRI